MFDVNSHRGLLYYIYKYAYFKFIAHYQLKISFNKFSYQNNYQGILTQLYNECKMRSDFLLPKLNSASFFSNGPNST